MKRLTTDKPKDNLAAALNLFYIKDRETWVRGGGPGPEYADVSLFDFTRLIVREHFPDIDMPEDNDTLGMMMSEWLLDGSDSMEGIIALIYTAAWTYSELRERLKAYEDTGLAPGTIKDVFGAFHKSDRAELEELRALIRAKHEGRLMELPCKVGSTVYVIGESCDFCETYLDEPERCMRCEKNNYIEERDFEMWMLAELDEFVFLTREEAEAALKGGFDV